MKNVKKFLLITLVSSVMMMGCVSTQENAIIIHQSNQAVISQLKPLNEFYKGHALEDCEKELSIDNYQYVIQSRVSGVYSNTLNESCIPISFEGSEPESFYDEIVFNAKDVKDAQEIVNHLKKAGYSDGADGMHIQKIVLNEGRVAQIMRFNDGKVFSSLKSMWQDRDDMIAYIDEFVFLHEIFHTSAMNFDKSLPRNIREGLSDVSAVVTLSAKHKLTTEQAAELALDVYRGRVEEASRNPYGQAFEGSHYNKMILLNMVNYLEDLDDEGGELRVVNSFKEANEYAMDMVLDLNKIERESFSIGEIFWERGMNIKKELLAKGEQFNSSSQDTLSITSSTDVNEDD